MGFLVDMHWVHCSLCTICLPYLLWEALFILCWWHSCLYVSYIKQQCIQITNELSKSTFRRGWKWLMPNSCLQEDGTDRHFRVRWSYILLTSIERKVVCLQNLNKLIYNFEIQVVHIESTWQLWCAIVICASHLLSCLQSESPSKQTGWIKATTFSQQESLLKRSLNLLVNNLEEDFRTWGLSVCTCFLQTPSSK